MEGHRNRSKPNLTSLTTGQSSMSQAFQGLSNRPTPDSRDSWTPEVISDFSDVDDASRLEPISKGNPKEVRSTGTTAVPSDDSSMGEDEKGHTKDDVKRRKSVHVVIEEAGQKSKFNFTTDDPEFKEMMQSGLQRGEEKRSGKSRGRPRDLVFTRQFTTFDRQNPHSQSPFHGFFTLFWISMALLLFKIAAWNYKTQGSVFGSAEILHLMVDRDLFVMLLTQGDSE
jgi:sterol O-acyltransferase